MIYDLTYIKDRLSYSADKLDKGDINLRELINLMKDMVNLLGLANVFKEANADGEKVSLEEDMTLELAEEAKVTKEAKDVEEAKAVKQAKLSNQAPPTTKPIPSISFDLIVHPLEGKASKENNLEERVLEEEPPFKKVKKSSEIIQEVFVKENIVVDGMKRNLIPPPGFEGTRGLIIREPKSGIFFYCGNFDLVFQGEEEFHLATTA
nr:hypothetical protein [Tanacetum cinerariifolium]